MSHLQTMMTLLHSVARALDNFKKIGRNNYTPAKVRSRSAQLEKTWSQCVHTHAALLHSTPEETRSTMDYFKLNLFEIHEDAFQDTLDYMNEVLESLEPKVSPNQSFSSLRDSKDISALSISHLPPINLPPFSGKFEDWESFRDRFDALIIQNPDLSAFARMHFLASTITGSALDAIKGLAITADNFDIAWQTLASRFENKRRLVETHVSTLINLPVLTRESASELRNLRDQATKSLASLQKLGRSSDEIVSDIIVYCVTSKLDSATRKAWKLKGSDNNNIPSFDDLDRFLSSRSRALEELTSISITRANPSTKRNVLSSHVATNSCILCKSEHFVNKCPQFLAKNPNQRADFIKKAHRCTNCLSAKHTTQACTSKFTCRICQKRHHSLLHADNTSHSTLKPTLSPSEASDSTESSPVTTLLVHQVFEDPIAEHDSTITSSDAFSNNDILALDLSVADSTVSPSQCSVDSTDHCTQTTCADSTVSPSLCSAETAECCVAHSSFPEQTIRPETLLATALVDVHSPSGRVVTVRALLDHGSQVTFITESVRQLLRTPRLPLPLAVAGLGAGSVNTCRHAAKIGISAMGTSTPTLFAIATVIKSITSYAPPFGRDIAKLTHISDLKLADSDPFSSSKIELLIGVDLLGQVHMDGFRRGPAGQPVAQNSLFGWVLYGPVASKKSSSHTAAVHNVSAAASLDTALTRFWDIEDIPQNHSLTADEQKCEAHFATTHSRTADGRYMVRLPFKKGPPIDIGSSRARAEFLLKSMLRRYSQNAEKYDEYNRFLLEYLDMRHMRRVPSEHSGSSHAVYIPHHPVIRQGSTTSHLRVVFNASSVTSNGTSLNDHLLSGAKLQTDLSAVLLRWRQYRYVYAADIEKMYRQILIDPRDADFQRILWTDAVSNKIQDFQLLTVTYGTVSAPFLALRVLRQLLADEGHAFPLAVPVLTDNIYVDDVLFGANDLSSLSKIKTQVCALLRAGKFELRKWSSNSNTLLSDIPVENHGLACSKTLTADDNLKILGINWNPLSDSFHFKASMPSSIPKTKRSILSTISKIFDPLGWATPVTIRAKVFMQTLWKDKIDWDESLPVNLLPQWNAIFASISALSDIRLSRFVGSSSETAQCELHGFADASTIAYAAVVYMRSTSLSGDVRTTLLVSKTKVAPVKTLSVPRLELSAALLLTRVLDFVQASLKLSSVPISCWTDSTIVLAWLRQHPSKWSTFVANRVAKIQTNYPSELWRHVSTHDNPADCATRGLNSEELASHPLWWTGPRWLELPHSERPSIGIDISDTDLEELSTMQSLIIESTPPWDLATKYSSWTKLIRVTAYVLLFISNSRSAKGLRGRTSFMTNRRNFTLTASDCLLARQFWYRHMQAKLFPIELNALLNGHSVSNKSPLAAMHPFVDIDKIIRVGGRLSNANLPFAVKHPIILASHPILKLIIRHIHVTSCHSGLQLTLATLRQKYWVLRSRTVVKSIIFACIPCTREKASTAKQLMGHFPTYRVTQHNRAFLHCGIDYAGPLVVRSTPGRGHHARKAYLAIFICMATKAVHLEVVDSYSTPSFISAFTRFCSRRGLPSDMYSDNGSTFVGADRELATAFRESLENQEFKNTTACDSINWHFIPPSAPHFGGLWEAGVKSVKHHLRRVLGSHTLTFEELTTLLCSIEACLNSRPLAPLTDSIDDYGSLTPGHFLIGSALNLIPEPSILDLNEHRITRWQLVRQMTERFWRLWQSDYVNTLQQRSKWRTASNSRMKLGQIVLIKNSLLPPCKWELGRITQCHAGPDGLVRVATVKTASSMLKRPIVKLCMLPVDLERPT